MIVRDAPTSTTDELVVRVGDAGCLPDGGIRNSGVSVVGGVIFVAGRQVVGNVGLCLWSPDHRELIVVGTSAAAFDTASRYAFYSDVVVEFDCVVLSRGVVQYRGKYRGDVLDFGPAAFLPKMPEKEDMMGLEAHSDCVSLVSCYGDSEARSGGVGLSAEVQGELDRLVDGKKVLFVGEYHVNAGVYGLTCDILKYLIGSRSVDAIVMEAPFSYGPFLDTYAQIADDAEARKFARLYLRGKLVFEGLIDVLEVVRLFNSARDERGRVRVFSADMELPSRVGGEVLEPYFHWYEPTFSLTGPSPAGMAEMERILQAVDRGAYPNRHPFMSTSFVRAVIANVERSVVAGRGMSERQSQIIDNLRTHESEYLGDGLTVFLGGAWHAVREPRESSDYYREAEYLDQILEPTRGRVATLLVRGMGYGFRDAVGEWPVPDWLGPWYVSLVSQFRLGLQEGTATEFEYYLVWGPPSALDMLVAYNSAEGQEECVWVEHMEACEGLSGMGEPGSINSLELFDGAAYVLRSQLAVPVVSTR
jgi:hypothetical protein